MKWLGAALIAGSLLLPPFLAGDFYINLASQILIAAIFALSLNLLVGFGGMTSLGHASYLGVAAYISALLTSKYGFGHGAAAIISIAGTVAMAAFFGVIALRATGLGFLMITLALSQVLWGLAYRLSDVTNGDNGVAGLTRPAPFGVSLDRPVSWGGVSGLLYVYYHKYIHPTSLSTTSSAEALLGVIAGGSGTLGGPVAGAALVLLMKNYASAYVERWNMLLGLVFLFIVLVMPSGVVPGVSSLVAKLRRVSR